MRNFPQGKRLPDRLTDLNPVNTYSGQGEIAYANCGFVTAGSDGSITFPMTG